MYLKRSELSVVHGEVQAPWFLLLGIKDSISKLDSVKEKGAGHACYLYADRPRMGWRTYRGQLQCISDKRLLLRKHGRASMARRSGVSQTHGRSALNASRLRSAMRQTQACLVEAVARASACLRQLGGRA